MDEVELASLVVPRRSAQTETRWLAQSATVPAALRRGGAHRPGEGGEALDDAAAVGAVERGRHLGDGAFGGEEGLVSPRTVMITSVIR